MDQLEFGFTTNELQDKYWQARELIVRFINGDPNVPKDALAWVEKTNVKRESKKRPSAGRAVQRSSNIDYIQIDENEDYPLIVKFKDGSKYAYATKSVTYNLADGTSETKTARNIFDLLCQEDDDVSGSVGHLFHHLIKRTDNKETPIKYKKI